MFHKTSASDGLGELKPYLKKAGYSRFTELQKMIIPPFLQGKDLLVVSRDNRGKTGSFLMPLLHRISAKDRALRALIVTHSTETTMKIRHHLGQFLESPRRLRSVTLSPDASPHKELKALSHHPALIIGTSERIIDHLRRENLNLDQVDTVIVEPLGTPLDSGFKQDILFIYSKLPKKVQTIFFTEERESVQDIEEILKRPLCLNLNDHDEQQENETMDNKRNDRGINEEALIQRINDALKAVKEEEDLDEITYLKKFVKKHTPFAMRGYLLAYLLKNENQGSVKRPRGRTGNPGGARSASSDNCATLFISIGRNRRVFPRDMIKLFTTALEMDGEAINNIKILDSYSFLEIDKQYADKAIEALNGTDFKGRKITVNYARKKN